MCHYVLYLFQCLFTVLVYLSVGLQKRAYEICRLTPWHVEREAIAVGKGSRSIYICCKKKCWVIFC